MGFTWQFALALVWTVIVIGVVSWGAYLTYSDALKEDEYMPVDEEEEEEEEDPRLEQAMETLGQFPHCDYLILHSPGTCEFCDSRPVWQALRVIYGINFTNEDYPNKEPCPSLVRRSLETINKWGGNRPHPKEVKPKRKTLLQRAVEDDDDGSSKEG